MRANVSGAARQTQAGTAPAGAAATTATVLGTRLTYERGLGVAGAWPAEAGQCFATERAGAG